MNRMSNISSIAALLCLALLAFTLQAQDSQSFPPCPDGYFYHNDQCQGKQIQIVECSSKCQTCEISPTNCLTCQDPTKAIHNGSCVDRCDDGYYLSQIGICEGCGDCSASTCFKCLNKSEYIYQTKCMKECPSGTVNALITAVPVLQEAQNVGLVIKDSVCKGHPVSLVNHPNSLIDTVNAKVISFQDIACSEECESCSQSNSKCLSCSPGYFQFGNHECLAACPSSTIPIDNTCQECDPSCEQCSEQTTQCTICSDKDKLQENGNCVKQCSDQFYNTGFGRCEPCVDSNCAQCNAFSCTKCKLGFYVHQSSCVSQCPTGTIQEQGMCQRCPHNCSSCYLQTRECGTCKEGYGLSNGACIPCKSNEFTNRYSQCQACSKDCSVCQSSSDYCIVCANPHFYLLNGVCQAECPESTFISNYQCKECSVGCKACTSAEQCLECQASLTLDSNGQCGSCRPDQFIWQKQCRYCHEFDSQKWSLSEMTQALTTCPQTSLPLSNYTQLTTTIQHIYEEQESNSVNALLDFSRSIEKSLTQEQFTHLSNSYSLFSLFLHSREMILLEREQYTLSLEINDSNPGNPKSRTRVSISIWTHGLLEQESKYPAFDVNFYNEQQELQNYYLPHPLKLALDFTHYIQPVQAAKLSNNRWIRKDIESILQGNSKILLEISSSGTYSLFPVNLDLMNSSSSSVESQIPILQEHQLLLLIMFSFIFLLLIVGLIFDLCFFCKQTSDYFPHQKQAGKNKSCMVIFLFSFFYNMPLLNLCAYQSSTILGTMKATWFSSILCIVHFTMILILHFSVVNLSEPGNKLILTCGFGLLFSLQLYTKSCHRKGDNSKAKSELQQQNKCNELKFYEITVQSSDRISISSQVEMVNDTKRNKHNKCCLVLMILWFVCCASFSIGVALQWNRDVVKHNNQLTQMMVFSPLMGLLFITARVAIASAISVSCEHSKCLKWLCVDRLSSRVAATFSPEQKHQIPSEAIKV